MPNDNKIRNLGQYGVITDQDPYDLPNNSVSFGKNIRFRNGVVTQSPVFKDVATPINPNPRYLSCILDIAEDDVFIGNLDGTVDKYQFGTITNYSPKATFSGTISGTVLTVNSSPAPTAPIMPGMTISGAGVTTGTLINTFGTGTGGAGTYNLSASQTVSTAEVITSRFTPVSAEGLWSSCKLADIVYINRNDRPPWYITNQATNFVSLDFAPGYASSADAWQSNWTCNFLTTCGGALVALGMTENGTYYPTKIRTSAFPLIDTTPVSWNQENPTTSASSNYLAEMEGPIIDACALGQNLVIFSQTQSWLMVPDNTSGLIFDYTQLPFSKGSIAPNCSVQINSRVYVFGTEDIWVTDGVTEQSICDQRTRDFIFAGLNISDSNACFVVHNEELKEILFCYPSSDGYTQWPSNANTPTSCNRSATYNYNLDQWVFDDIPYLWGGGRANFPPSGGTLVAWDNSTSTWDLLSGPWSTLTDTSKRCVCTIGSGYNQMVGTTTNVILNTQLYAFDKLNNGATNFSVDALASIRYPYFECTGVDLDEVGKQLNQYWQFNWIVPQGRIDPQSNQLLQFSLGSSDGYNDAIVYEPYLGYNGNDLYYIDSQLNGRFMSIRFQFNDFRDFSLSGFDINVQPTGLLR